MARPKTPLLSRSLIARTALEQVRQHHDFTIPGLAQQLGVNPSSLYHHVPGGRAEIIDLMRETIYEHLDLTALRASGRPWQERINEWTLAYREASAQVPWLVPLIMAHPVDDQPTQEIYETLFAILAESGAPQELWVSIATMFDVIALGSAMDEQSPVPLWRDMDSRFVALREAVTAHDTQERKRAGLVMAIEAAVAYVETIARTATEVQAAS